MHNPVKVPSTRRAAPTSGALDPLRARQIISSALPSLSAMATPEALVNAWARCAITARSSEEAPRALLLAVLLAVSDAWVAIVRRPEKFSLSFKPGLGPVTHAFNPGWLEIASHGAPPRRSMDREAGFAAMVLGCFKTAGSAKNSDSWRAAFRA